MLKLVFLIITVFFLASCYELPQNIEVSTKPIPTPTLTEFERIKKDKHIEQVKKDVEESIKEESKLSRSKFG